MLLAFLILHFSLATIIAALVGTYLDQCYRCNSTFKDLMYPKFDIIKNNTSLTSIQATSLTTGNVFSGSLNALTGGGALSFNTTSIAYTGNMVIAQITGNNAAVTGHAIHGEIAGASSLGIAGYFTSSSAGFVVEVHANGTGGIAVFKDSTVAMLTIANGGAITCGTTATLIVPVRASVADVQGTIYYDTDTNKLVFGTGSGFETITSS